MFVRFRQSRRRLQASLIETRRVDAKVQHEHIAGLGAVNLSPSVADRIAFWEGVFQRLDKLSNRLDATAQGKILAALHARVPIVAVEEIRALQLENAQADERSWSALRDMHQGTLDDNRALAAKIENTIADAQAGVDMSAAGAAGAAEKVAKIKAGQDVSGGAAKAIDLRQLLREAGWSTADFTNALTLAKIGDLGGLDEFLEVMHSSQERARRAAARAFLRKLRRRAPA